MDSVSSSSAGNIRWSSRLSQDTVTLLSPVGIAIIIFLPIVIRFCRKRIAANATFSHQARLAAHIPYMNADGTVRQNIPAHWMSAERIHGMPNSRTQVATSTHGATELNFTYGDGHLHDNRYESANLETVTSPPLAHTSAGIGVVEIERFLDTLPQMRFSAEQKEHCIICFDLLSDAVVTMGACCHPMHLFCLAAWLRTSKGRSCPLCRTALLANLP